MKNLMIFAAVFAVIGAPVAMADDHGGAEGKGKMLEKFDADGSGTISKEEFLKSSEDRFSKMDTNGDGEITKEEAKAMKEKMREKMKERMQNRKERRGDRRSSSE